jgi:hypothetical protein
MTLKRDLVSGVARHSIFSALVGPRPVMAPETETGNGGGSGAQGGAGAGGAGSGAGGESGGAGGGESGAAGGGAGAGAGGEGAGGAGGAAEGGDKSILAGLAAKEGEGKEGDKPAGEGAAKKEGEGEPGKDEAPKDVDGNAIPETYEIKMPDGVTMDAGLLEAVTPMFREARLSPAQAQVVADAYMMQQTKALEAHSEQTKAWMNEAKQDKEIGGRDFSANMGAARKAFQEFGSERAVQIFDTYGLGNNPDVLRMFVRIGKAMGEGGTVLGGDGGGRVSAARDMYPDMYKGK